MKSLMISLFLLCLSVSGFAQKDTAVIRVMYDVCYQGNKYDDMELLVGNKISKFYSLAKVREKQKLDSVNRLANGEGYASIIKSLKANNKGEHFVGQEYVIYKHLPTDSMLTYCTTYLLTHYKYEEGLSIAWKLCEDNDTISGYHCCKAMVSHRGQVWIAWYAPDIPISDGPWKLCGLPGLILKAETKNGGYRFACREITPSPEQIIEIDKEKATKISPKSMAKLENTHPVLYLHEVKGFPLPKGAIFPKNPYGAIESY